MDYRDELIVFLSSLEFENENLRSTYDLLFEAEDFFKIKDDEVRELLKSKSDKVCERILKYRSYDRVQKILDICYKKGIKISTINSGDYPESLRPMENSPMILYKIGDLDTIERGVAIVGSRKPSLYGKNTVATIVRGIRDLNPTIISGMAYGIDAQAHLQALDNDLKTVCVLGCGVDFIYPKTNRQIYQRVIESGGLIVSEYPPDSKPRPYRFPLRNRIISGLSHAVIVVEAKEKSGSLITATIAATQGKEVFAVPGPINSPLSKGTNKLIRDGATIFTDVEDLREVLPFAEDKKEVVQINLDMEELLIYDLIKRGTHNVDSLLIESQYEMNKLNEVLTMLELKNLIFSSSYNEYEVTN